MCGIFGIAGLAYRHGLREQAARTQHHRGPDGFGSVEDHEQQLYLAHCRLSVLDLSANGAQPMANEDESLWIVFNGEIYGFASLRSELQARGHQFRSSTDTEVILHAYEEWGIHALHKLNGMFAFALWDSKQRLLHLVRDRFGIKPLYVARSSSGLAFASDARALLALPSQSRQLDPSALVSYLLSSYVVGRRSIWSGIERLRRGHRLEVDLGSGQISEHRWWSPAVQQIRGSFEHCYEQFSACFEQCVAESLVSDVPVGVFLSGGYDSSAIASVASRLSPRIHTFSIGFEGWEANETATARETASRLGTTHCEAQLGAKDFGNLTELMGLFDEPVADSSIFPSVAVAALARQQATVALAGDGGDEVLGGYRWYQQIVHPSKRKQLAFRIFPLLHALGLGNTPQAQRCDPFAHYRFLTSPGLSLSQIRTLFPWLPAEALPNDASVHQRSADPPGQRGYRRWQSIDMNTYMPDCNLYVADRASMAHSLELRVPFLDHRLVELVLSFPEALVTSRGEPKRLLSHWLDNHQLSHLLSRSKQGFSTPLHLFWSRQQMQITIRTGALSRSGLIDAKALNTTLDSCGDFSLRILAILSLWAEAWHPA